MVEKIDSPTAAKARAIAAICKRYEDENAYRWDSMVSDLYDAGRKQALQEIDKLKAELTATEKRVREECAKAVCAYCRGKELFGLKPLPAEYTSEHRWIHRMIREDLEAKCDAAAIRSLELKGE